MSTSQTVVIACAQQALVRSGEPVDRARLADPAVAPADLLPAGARDA